MFWGRVIFGLELNLVFIVYVGLFKIIVFLRLENNYVSLIFKCFLFFWFVVSSLRKCYVCMLLNILLIVIFYYYCIIGLKKK